MGIPVRRRSASELQFDEGDRVGPYQVTRRVAPACYDGEALASGAPVRIELASADDTALIDVRFSRARAQLELVDHPCVAQIVDHGVLSNGRPWVASHRPAGTALSDVLAERRLLPRETIALLYSVAQVLAFAHHRQIVHGALRPHHLTLSRGAKVSISGWAWLRSSGIPAFGDPASTSVYNAPEHDGQSAIDGRADVYALGAIAYRSLTGVFPDVSRDLLDSRDPLCAVIENMLALDVRDRGSAASVVADLHQHRRSSRASSQNLESGERAPSQSDARREVAPSQTIELRSVLNAEPPPPRIERVRSQRDKNRPTRPMESVEDEIGIEQRRTNPMQAMSRDIEQRRTNPVMASHRDDSDHTSLHERTTDRMARAADQELTDISPTAIDETELSSSLEQDVTDLSSSAVEHDDTNTDTSTRSLDHVSSL